MSATTITRFVAGVSTFGGHCDAFASAITNFGRAVANIPGTIALTSSHRLDINISGDKILDGLDDKIKAIALRVVDSELGKFSANFSVGAKG
jgi:hypothetical protein